MTLLLTEIIEPPVHAQSLIVFAADRRISRAGVEAATRPKVFRVPKLRAGIGYFGLAELPGKKMDAWLTEFIEANQAVPTLAELATTLAAALNNEVPAAWRQSDISGFHLAGFTAADKVEFWFVRNVRDDRVTTTGIYEAREDYQREHRPKLKPGEFWIYRNGDLRAHVAAWEKFDEGLGTLFEFPDFRPITTPEQYLAWTRFKFEALCTFYEDFCSRSIIGLPVDAFVVTPTGFLPPL